MNEQFREPWTHGNCPAMFTNSRATVLLIASVAWLAAQNNPYRTIEGWAKMPEGRTWGSTSAVDIDRDGRSIWVAERCGANTCLNRATGEISELPTILRFDSSGQLVKSFGNGLLIFPHGIHVDREGNIWVTDGQDNAPARIDCRSDCEHGSAGAAARCHQGSSGLQVQPGRQAADDARQARRRRGDPDYFYQPNDVVTAPNGDIFVSEGHGGANSRILKFTGTGKLIKHRAEGLRGRSNSTSRTRSRWTRKGRLFVGDRGNNRIQIFDQDGNFIDEWKQFSRPSGIYIDKNDVIYVADSESGAVGNGQTRTEKRGIRVGRISDGKVIAFIPDPVEVATNTSAAEGVAADVDGNIYGAEVGSKSLKKYVK